MRVLVLATLISAGPLSPRTSRGDVVSMAGADQLTADAASLGVISNAVSIPVDPVGAGVWSSVIPWTPHIPVSVAQLPDGRLLTWAGEQRTSFDGQSSGFTYAAVWNPRTAQFTEINNTTHDMFCGGVAMLPDGRVFVNGGDGCNAGTSIFDWRTNRWTSMPGMNDIRWYNPSVTLPDGAVFTVSGNTGARTAERWEAATGWRRLTGIDWQPVLSEPGYAQLWHPFLALAPNGKLFHFGPTVSMHWVTPTGAGSLQNSGQSVPGGQYPKEGGWVMYEEGRILVAGGSSTTTPGGDGSTGTSTKASYVVDLNGATPTVTPDQPLRFARQLCNSVVLPNGEVMLIGGNDGTKFSDNGSILTPEIWNPRTHTWRSVAALSVPRNYHSTALLLADGRVWAGGGGLGGGNHQDAQIYTPPALLKADGSAAVRPVISGGASTIGYGQTFSIAATPGLTQFAFVRMASLTHAVSTDLRRIVLPSVETSAGAYQLTSHANPNVMTPGYWMLFGINPSGVYSEAKIVLVTTQNTPSITSPGDQQTQRNQSVNLAIESFVPGAATAVFSATNLPAGLSIDPASGKISGVANTSGIYRPVVTVSAAGQNVSTTFLWTVLVTNLGSGTLTREVWTNLPGATVAQLTSNAAYPANPTSRGTVTSFEAPTTLLDNYGQRIRGYVYAPVSGDYVFYLASDDNGQLSLSTDSSPANARVIATVGDWTSPREWTRFASQKSATIPLVGGRRYYIEALMKEGSGGDNLAVGWTIPGTLGISVITGEYISVNTPPSIVSPGPLAHVVGENLAISLQASDADRDALTFTASGLPPGLSIAPDAAVISGAPTQAGTYNVTVTANDGAETGSVTFTWTIRNALILPPLTGNPLPGTSAVALSITGSGGTNARYTWNFGDGTPDSAWSPAGSVAHTFPGPGRYLVTVTAQDDTGRAVSSSFWQVIYAPLTASKPTASSALAYVPAPTGNARLWVANPDADTVAVLDAVTGARLAEISVPASPRCVALAPDGRVWISSAEGPAISVVNATSFAVAQTLSLPRGSRPFGLAFQPDGRAAWLTLEATGQLLQLDATTGAILRTISVGPNPRHLSISADSSRVLVSRFITPPLPGEATATIDSTGRGGEVLVVDAAAGAIVRTAILQHSEAAETQSSARGIPNYLGAPVISPDGLSAWVPSKQDNIKRGQLRANSPLTHDGTVRAIASKLVLPAVTEDYASRVDFDNMGVPSAAAFDPFGGYLFVALEASREVALVDVFNARRVAHFSVGRAPQAVLLSPDGRTLYVQNFTDRTVSLLNVSVFQQGRIAEPAVIATTNTVAVEKLPAPVLRGKQLFYDAADTRLALESYISCAACHNDGGSDGRTWDFTSFGEGLRNTPTLRGHARQGPSHWSGNFDEVQDFENQIRNFAGGSGLIENGTPNAPLAAPNAGRSADLDALAAYVNSLTTHGASPATPAAAAVAAGRVIFQQQNCASCHSGPALTNSALGVFADIGTIKPSSGNRLGAPLTGLDVPTLRGLWGTAPYLHDGSAPTLDAAIAAHRGVNLTSADRANLAAFLLTLDDSAAAPNQFALAGFESPSLGGSFLYAPSGTPWSFSASAGIAGNASAFTQGNPNAPEGTQVLFLQFASTADQAVTLRPGSYRVRFSAAQRATFNTAPQTLVVTANGVEIARIAPASTNYTTFDTAAFTAGSSPVSLRIAGTGKLANGSTITDTTALVDDLQIIALNSPPNIVAPIAQSTPRGATVKLAITASDTDLGQTLTYSATGLPAGLAIDASSGIISGVVAGNAASDNVVIVTVNDGIVSSSASFSWSVTPGRVANFSENFNGAALDATRWSTGSLYVPLTGVIDPQNTVVQQGGQLVITPRASAEGYNYNGLLSNWAVDLRGSAVTVAATPAAPGALTWFALGHGRDFALIAVTAGSIYMEQTVDGVSDFLGIPNDPALYRLWRIRHDVLSDTIIFEAGPDGLSWTQLRAVPRQIAIDSMQIEFVAGTYHADPNPGSATFDDLVYTPNRAPVLTRPANISSRAGIVTSLQLTATDPDAQTLAFSATGLPAGLQFDPASGVISGKPTTAGLNTVSVAVSDGLLTSTATFTWNISPATGLGAEWTSGDVGTTTIAGTTLFANGIYTLTSAGFGAQPTGDQLQYAAQQFVGDGELIVRVTSQTAVDPSSRAGLIFRETWQPNSRYAALFLTPGKGFVAESRATTAGSSIVALGARFIAPNNWLRLVRSGDTFTSFRSNDGVKWTQVDSQKVVMTRALTVGLAASSRVSGKVTTATFDNLRITPSTLPAPWIGGDVGTPDRADLETYAAGKFTISGGGSGISGAADNAHFTNQTLTGNGEIVAHVAGQSNTYAWAKAGVMIRDSSDAKSRMALLCVTQGNGIYFQTRAAVGAAAATVAAPRGNLWLRLVRTGNTVAGYRSADGVTWTLVGSSQVAFGQTVSIGLAVTAGGNGLLSTAIFDSVTVTPGP